MTPDPPLGDPGRKTFFAGTHRTADPQETCARVLALAPRVGVTRLSVLTGLDVIGIPVAAAIRPNSRSVSVHQGKGLSLAAAKASALMEAVEMFHAETIPLPLRLASHAEMAAAAAAVDPRRLPRARSRQAGSDRLLWIEGRDLFGGVPLFVPFELVSADFTAPLASGMGLFQATTNGLASGNTMQEAVLHALYEAVERDAVSLWHARTPASQDARLLDLRTVDDPAALSLLDAYRRADIAVRVWDCTTDTGLPVFLSACSSGRLGDGVRAQFGSGCHAAREIALARALTEAAQARLTVISGAREDVDPVGYADRDDPPFAEARDGPRSFQSVPSVAGATLRDDLEAALRCLAAAGLTEAACVDLTRPVIGLPVVRVIVPGLEGPWTSAQGEYTPGARARCAAG